MKKVICLMCALAIAPMVLASAVAEDQHVQTFHNHSISFEIPDGWEVCLDVMIDDNSSTIITDGEAAIRIDTIKLPDAELDEIVRDYCQKTSDDYYQIKPDATWHAIYKKESWRVVDAFCEHYRDHVVPPAMPSLGSRFGIGSDDFLTSGEYIAYCTNGPRGNLPEDKLLEWYLVWIRPEYNSTFIAVHALFPVDHLDDYGIEKLTGFGRAETYHWPGPLYNVMTSFSTDWSGRLCKGGLRTGEEELLSLV